MRSELELAAARQLNIGGRGLRFGAGMRGGRFAAHARARGLERGVNLSQCADGLAANSGLRGRLIAEIALVPGARRGARWAAAHRGHGGRRVRGAELWGMPGSPMAELGGPILGLPTLPLHPRLVALRNHPERIPDPLSTHIHRQLAN